jgi:hypothetical protein
MFWPFLSAQILKNTNKSTERPSIKIATAQNFEQNLYVGLRNFSVLGTMVPFCQTFIRNMMHLTKRNAVEIETRTQRYEFSAISKRLLDCASWSA